MDIIISDEIEDDRLTNTYVVTVNTMEGDADDYHQFESYFCESNIKGLKEFIIYCEVLKKQYPHGRGGSDDYNSLSFFEEDFYEWYQNSCGCRDDMDDYSVSYFDFDGNERAVDIAFNDDDRKVIDSYGILR